MKTSLCVVVLALSALSVSSEKARFDNYRVYSIQVESREQLSVLMELSEKSDSYSFWEPPSKVGSLVDLVVPPHQFAHFADLIKLFGFKVTLTNSNLQKSIDDEMPKRERKVVAGEMDWTSYHRVGEIYDWLDSLAREFPDFITVQEIGKTYEGRPLKLVKLSKKENNRAVFIEANIHAREWIASATATYFLNELLRSNNIDMQDMATNIDWYIIPVMNPDGLEYTHTDNRNWRKSRSRTSLVCWGVDPNRNWAHNWLIKDETGDEGASRAPCSDVYAGPYPFSENETLAVENFLKAHHGKFDVYLSFHSYGHLVLLPYGHTRTRVPNYDELMKIGEAAAEKLKEVEGIEYEVGNTIEMLYAASGVSVDHAYGHHGIPIAYTYEMRGNGPYGRYGFVLPKEFIIPNAREITESLKGLVAKSREFGYLDIPFEN